MKEAVSMRDTRWTQRLDSVRELGRIVSHGHRSVLRQLALLAGVLLLAVGCSERKSSPAEESAKPKQPEAPVQAELDPVTPPATPGLPDADELQWQDTLRLLETSAAFLVLETVLPADASPLRNHRQTIAKAMALSPTDTQEFARSLLRAMRTDLGKYQGTAMAASTQQLDVVLAAQLGEASVAEFAKAARSLRPVPALAHIGTLFELAHSAKAMSQGLGEQGTPAHGIGNALLCPSAAWLEPGMGLSIQSSGRLPPTLDVLSELKGCLDYCPGVSAAEELSALVMALSQCKRVRLPQASSELLTPLALINALAVGELLEARKRLSEVQWVIGKELPDAALGAVDDFIKTAKLVTDFLPSIQLPGYPYLGSEVVRVSYLLELGPEGFSFAQWPVLTIKDGRLNLAKELSRAVEIGVPTSLRPVLRPELSSSVGIVLPPQTPLSELRQVLKALRTLGIAQRYLAVANSDGPLWWLSVESNPSAVVDVLLQQTPNTVSVWAHPGAVSEAAIDTLPAEPKEWPGQLSRASYPDQLRDALPAVHDALAAATVGKVLLDFDDALPLAAVLELVSTLDYPRRLKLRTADELVGAATVTPNEKRIDTIFITEYRARTLPQGSAPVKQGVTLPAPFEIAITGPLTVAALLEGLGTLRGPLGNCYEREAAVMAGLSGVVSIELSIDASGTVTAVNTVSNTTGSELLQACVEDGLPLLSFPASDGGASSSARFPVYFDPLAP